MNIASLLPQMVKGKTEITVVDNNSTDATHACMESLIQKEENINYIQENRQGHCYARNRGWEESSYEWIFYIDDDCVPSPQLVVEALKLIESHPEMDALGGPIDALFASTPPVWLPEGFGNYSIDADDVIPLEKGYLRGNCFLVRRSVLEELNGFDTTLGMVGKKIQYADELEFQFRMRQHGFKIGYAPSLRMPHYVRTEKISLGWLIHSEYAKRRDKMSFDPESIPAASLHLIRTIGSRILRTPLYFSSLLMKKKYTWHHFVLDTVLPLSFRTGELIGTIKHRFK